MAVQSPVSQDGNTTIVVWGPFAAGDTFLPFVWADRYDIQSVQVYGTFTGSTVTLNGTNEVAAVPSNMTPLPDPAGNALAFTQAGLRAVGAICHQMAPSVASGSGTGLYVLVCLKSVRR